MNTANLSPEARAALERDLDDPARRAEAARALVEVYREAGDTAKLLSALDALAGAAPDPAERALALRDAAQVYLLDLKQPDLALATAARALPLAPAEPELFATARQAAEQAGLLDTYADLLGELLEKSPSSAHASVHRELAELQEQLGDGEAALRHLRLAVEADPRNPGTLEALLRIYRARGQWAALAEAQEKASLLLPDERSRLEALREAANVHEIRLDDKESALECWQGILGREPGDREAALALERLAVQLDRPAELASALQYQRLTEEPGPRNRELVVRLAQVKLERMNDAAAALDLCELALAQDASHAVARQISEACALRPGNDGAAAHAVVDRRYARQGLHEARVALCERRLAGAAAPEERSALFATIRDLCDGPLRQPARAFQAGLEVFAAGVDREKLRPELERLAELSDSLEELVEVFEAAANALMPGDALAAPLCRAAAGMRERLGQPEVAARMWKELLAESPGDREALERLAFIYKDSGDAKGLAEVNARNARLATDPAERAVLLERAAAAREAAGDDEAATEDYRAVLALKTSVPALVALDRILGRAQRHAEQAEVVAQLAALTVDVAERRGLRLRCARLQEKEGTGPAALRSYAAVLSDEGSNAEAIAGLERLLERDDVCREAAGLLERAWRRAGNLRKLAEVLELKVDRVPPRDRGAILAEVAALREKLGERDAAFAARVRAFRECPEDSSVRAELERAAESGGGFDALVGAYEEALERGAAEPLATELWGRVAALYTERLRRPELATRAILELSRRSPDDPELLRRLAESHRRTGSHRPLVEALRRLASLEPAVETKVELLFEAAQVAEDSLGDKALAIASYRRVLDLQPADRNAIKLLERLLAATGQHEALAALLDQDVRLAAGTPEEAAPLQVALARLKARELADPRGAVRLLAQVLSACPFHRGASELVEALAGGDGPAREDAVRLRDTMLEGGGDPGRLVGVLEARLAAQPAHSERVVLLRKLAVIRARRQGEPELGFLAAAQALRAAPGDAAALQLCAELSEEAGAGEDLEALLQELAPLAIGAATRVSLFRALARLQQKAGDDAGAEKSLRELLEAAPGDREASEALEAVYQRLGRPRDQVELLRRRLVPVREAAGRVALLERIAGLCQRAGDEAAAAEALREALALDPRPALLAQLEPMLGRLGRFEEQADALRDLAKGMPPEDARELLGRRGTALAAAGQLEQAVSTWEQVLARWPGDGEAVAGLEGVLSGKAAGEAVRSAAGRLLEAAYRARGDSRRLVEMLELRLEGAPAAERAALLAEVAVLREDLGDATLAFSARRRLFAEAPGDAETRAALERLAVGAGLSEELLAAYEDTLERGIGSELALALWRRIAQIRSEPLTDRDAAAAAWEQVAQRTPGEGAALAALAALWRGAGDLRRLADVLARQAELEPTPGAKAARLHEAAQMARDRGKDEGLAVRCYQRILDLFPDDRRALDALRALVSAGGPRGALAKVIEREIALAAARGDLPAGLERRLELARIRLDYLNDAAGAFALWDEALKLSPGYRPALEELEQLALSDDPERLGAFARLEPALEAASDWPRLVRILEVHAAAAPPAERGGLLARAAGVCASLGDPGHAFVLVARALRGAPTDEPLLARCRELATKAGMRDELCALLEDLAETAEGGTGGARLHAMLAAELERAGDDGGARRSWQRVLELAPGDLDAQKSLEALLARGSGWADLASLLERRLAAATDPKEIAALWTRIAEARRKAGDEAGAVDALREVFAVDPVPETLEELGRLLGALGRHREQAEVLDRLAELVPEPDRRRRFLLGRAEALRLAGAFEPAADVYQVAFALGGADDALREGLERLVESQPGLARAASLLEEVRRGRG
ncbi:MAG TPA: hypothetical protein VGK67_30135 [Myxococcales bacterium]